MRGSALVFVEEGWSDGARALVGALGSEEFLVSPRWAKSQWQQPEAAAAVGGTHPPFGPGDGKLALTGGTQGAKEPGRARRRT